MTIPKLEDTCVTGPCQHKVLFDESCIEVDRFQCPVCGLHWGVHIGPPTIYPSGFVAPGKRQVYVENRFATAYQEEIAIP